MTSWVGLANTNDNTTVQKVAVYDKGTGGNRTSDMLARFSADVLALNPDAVHILGGGNDVATDDRASADIIADLDSMVDAAVGAGITVLLGTITPSDFMDTPGKLATLDTVNDWIAAQSGRATIIDYATALSVGGLSQELDDAYHSDGVHWDDDAEGKQVAADLLSPVLDAL